jgi:hypothetical protein
VTPLRTAVVVVVAAAAAAAAVAAALVGASAWQRLALILACLLTAAVVVLLPPSLRARIGLFVGAFVAAAGVLTVFVQPAQDSADRPRTNARYLADLVARGPFSEQLRAPLVGGEIAPIGIGDPSAAGRLTAVQVRVSAEPPEDVPDLQMLAHIEVYPSEEAARARATASKDLLQRLFDPGLDRGSLESFCVARDNSWTCAGSRRFVYAEVTLSPGPNAYRPFATETVAALLRYGDHMTALATS